MIAQNILDLIAAYRIKHPRSGRKKIAKHFRLSENEARWALRNLGVKECAKEKSAVLPALAPTIEEDIVEARRTHREKESKAATDRYHRLLARVSAEREVIEDFKRVAEEALTDGVFKIEIPALKLKGPTGVGQDEEAVLVISDSHVGKLVFPDKTTGFGNYNPAIFLAKLAFLEKTVTRLLRENVANPVRTLNILFLGDLIEGMLNHAEEIPNRWLVVDQCLLASTALYQFVARLAQVVPNVVCRGVGGNHARWGTQKKPPTANRYSNFDFIVLGQIQALLAAAGPGNVEFRLEENAFQVFDIYDWRFKIAHGDHLKGGDKAMGTPSHSMGREINATTQRYNAIGQKAPDYYLCGDKHRFVGASTATGRYLINGAWFSDDEYALHENFSPCQPFQHFALQRGGKYSKHRGALVVRHPRQGDGNGLRVLGAQQFCDQRRFGRCRGVVCRRRGLGLRYDQRLDCHRLRRRVSELHGIRGFVLAPSRAAKLIEHVALFVGIDFAEAVDLRENLRRLRRRQAVEHLLGRRASAHTPGRW